MFLDRIRRKPGHATADAHPWSVPALHALDELRFTTPVTFLVGENGCGKSTLLEGLAVGMDAVAAGARDLARDDTLDAARTFADACHFGRTRHPRVRLFLRAEDVFGFTRRVQADVADLGDLEQHFRNTLPEGSWGQRLATGAARGQRRALEAAYGSDPHARSHGETFLALLDRRLVPDGLYFLDEPETPLSPLRVLALVKLLADRVADGCQFIVATHSPILMALPGATILLLDGDGMRPVAWNDTEHVRLTKAFLDDPENYLRRLRDAPIRRS